MILPKKVVNIFDITVFGGDKKLGYVGDILNFERAYLLQIYIIYNTNPADFDDPISCGLRN
jgi:hypothetical protein